MKIDEDQQSYKKLIVNRLSDLLFYAYTLSEPRKALAA